MGHDVKINEVIIILVTNFALAACSSGSSGGSASGNGFTVSDKTVGHFAPDQDLTKNQPETEAELQSWYSECEKVDGFSLGANFKVGQKVVSREDSIDLWPDLKSTGDVRIYNRAVEKIVGPKEFISVGTQTDKNFSISTRNRHTADTGGFGSNLVEIISTNPPELAGRLRDKIGSGAGASDENSIRCKSDPSKEGAFNRVTTKATLVLSDGTAVQGILVTEHSERINYVCGLYKKDETLIKEVKLSDRAIEERIEFYAKDVVNPFESKCHSSSGLLNMTVIRDSTGTKGILTLNKNEVLSIKN